MPAELTRRKAAVRQSFAPPEGYLRRERHHRSRFRGGARTECRALLRRAPGAAAEKAARRNRRRDEPGHARTIVRSGALAIRQPQALGPVAGRKYRPVRVRLVQSPEPP